VFVFCALVLTSDTSPPHPPQAFAQHVRDRGGIFVSVEALTRHPADGDDCPDPRECATALFHRVRAARS
jgi:hypothetical protein